MTREKLLAMPAARELDGKAIRGSRHRILTSSISTILAGIGILGGVGILFLGLACVLLAAITGDRSFDQVGTKLLIGAIPTILVGSVFLDEIQGKK